MTVAARKRAGAARAQATRERVVAAAAPLFVARGYLDTTMAELAGAAGVAVQTLYLAFGSKAAVLAAVWDAAVPDRPAGWAAALAAAPDGPAGARPARRRDDGRGRAQPPVGRRAARGRRRSGARRAAGREPGGGARRPCPRGRRARRTPGVHGRHVAAARHGRPATLLAPETYGLLVVQQGWTTPDWAEWALRHLVADLFPGAERAMPWPPSPDAGQTGRVVTWTVMPAPGPIGALTVGATADGLALVVFGDHPEAAAQSAERLGVAAQGPMRLPEARLDAERAEAVAIPAGAKAMPTGRSAAVRERAVAVDRAQAAPTPAVGAVLERAVAQLREYFAGERRVFDVPLDWSLTRGSQRRVLGTLFATVGYGETVTYGELAARSELGSAYTAARGVGAIMGSNPLPVVVPCHRVMAADGLGGFGGGRATKEWLLAHEGVLTRPSTSGSRDHLTARAAPRSARAATVRAARPRATPGSR